MENLVDPSFWQGKRIFLSGHTGFKGSWLALWLQQMGAQVTGYALTPATTPNLFTVAGVAAGMTSLMADIREAEPLRQTLSEAQPEIVFHLAAQALVGESYQDPLGTYATNVQGTANLLEAVRHAGSVKAVVVVTSDKCYENREWPWPYRENEALGGHDPYSSSKACAELVTAAYRKSFLASAKIAVATARAGNVIGGGDWSPSRLVPDLLKAFAAKEPALLRRPHSVRPWQHVLEPLAGYLMLAQHIHRDPTHAPAWNFGPAEHDHLTAGAIAEQLSLTWGETASWITDAHDSPHEAGLLRLDSSLAHQQLGWAPRWPLATALNATTAWHKAWLSNADMRQFTLTQINQYTAHDLARI